MKEMIYEVYWDGPYTSETIDAALNDDDKYPLYAIYGSHPMYGDNILLYIGMTERGIPKRLSEHGYWMDQQRHGPSKIFVASIGLFKSWEHSNNIEEFDLPTREVVQQVEQLLIISNEPVHNQKSRKSARAARGIRIFNTNNYGSLLPEASALYHWC